MRGLLLVVMGEPVAKERPRTVTDRNGKTRTFTPGKTLEAEDTIAQEFRAQFVGFGDPVTDPVRVRLDFHTASKSKDVDNLAKTTLDALNGIIWQDDKQIEELHARVFRDGEREPQTWIDVRW